MKEPLKLGVKFAKDRTFWQRVNVSDRLTSVTSEQIDYLKRSVKVINEDVIEIKNFALAVRHIALVAFLMVFSVFGGLEYQSQGKLIPSSIWIIVDPQGYGEWFISDQEKRYNEGERFEEKYRAERKQDFIDYRKSRKNKIGYFLLFMVSAPLAYWLFWPTAKGVRIDRRRKLIYTVRWGRLYCQKIFDPDLTDLEAAVHRLGWFVPTDPATSPLIYVLPNTKEPEKGYVFGLGHNPVSLPFQGDFLHNAVASFLFENGDGYWLRMIKRDPYFDSNWNDIKSSFYCFHLFKARWPKNIDEQLDAFLAKSKTT